MGSEDRAATALIRAVVRANFHAGGVRCLRLWEVQPTFLADLAVEVRDLSARHPPSDVARPDHPTHWTRPRGAALQWALLNASGRFDDPSMDHDRSRRAKRFHHRDAYPRLAALVDALPHAVNMRLAGLGPSSGLFPHEEHVLVRHGHAWTVRTRFHLPVLTSPAAEILLDGHWFQLEAGGVYFINNGCVHTAVNRGTAFRYHLIWDMPLTRETFARMFGEEENGTIASFAARVPAGARTPAPIRTEPPGPYTIAHPAFRAYAKLQLHRLGVPPHRFGNLYARLAYHGFFRRFASYDFAPAPVAR